MRRSTATRDILSRLAFAAALSLFLSGCASPRFYGVTVLTRHEGARDVKITNEDTRFSGTFGAIVPKCEAGWVDFFPSLPRSVAVEWRNPAGMTLSSSKPLPSPLRKALAGEEHEVFIVLDGTDWHYGYEVPGARWHFLEILGEAPDERAKRRLNLDLMEALNAGDLRTAQLLLDHGADINHRLIGSQMSPLGATLDSTLVATRFALDHGAVPGIEVMWACRDGDLERLALFTAYRADLNFYETDSGNYSPLVAAASAGHLDVVRFLVEHDADVNKPIYNNVTPLYAAALSRRVDLAEYLLKHGANPYSRLSMVGTRPCDIARERGDTAMVDLLERWMTAGATGQ